MLSVVSSGTRADLIKMFASAPPHGAALSQPITYISAALTARPAAQLLAAFTVQARPGDRSGQAF
jgi:hypothetical protein